MPEGSVPEERGGVVLLEAWSQAPPEEGGQELVVHVCRSGPHPASGMCPDHHHHCREGRGREEREGRREEGGREGWEGEK